MKEDLVGWGVAKLAKEKGFNVPVYYHYSENPINDIIILCEPDDPQVGQGWILEDYNDKKWLMPKVSAPTQSLLQKWIREVYKINIIIIYGYSYSMSKEYYCFRIRKLDSEDLINEVFGESDDTYELALEEGLKQALLLINN